MSVHTRNKELRIKVGVLTLDNDILRKQLATKDADLAGLTVHAQGLITQLEDRIKLLLSEQAITSAAIGEMKEKFVTVENERDVQAYRANDASEKLAKAAERVGMLERDNKELRSNLSYIEDAMATLMAVLKKVVRGG